MIFKRTVAGQKSMALTVLLLFAISFTSVNGYLESDRRSLFNATIDGGPLFAEISNGAEVTYQYTISMDTNIRIKTEVTAINDDSFEYPVIFQVRQQQLTQSWRLPVVSFSNHGNNYTNSERTLCSRSQQYHTTNAEWLITVTVSTASSRTIQYSIAVEYENDVIVIGENKQVEVFPMSPQLLHFDFPSLSESKSTDVDLVIESEDPGCVTVSFQHPNCPFLDLETNVRYKGYFHTMVHKGGMTIPRHMFQSGVFIVLVMHDSDALCDSVDLQENERKEEMGGTNEKIRINAMDEPRANGNRILFVENRKKLVNVSLKKSVTKVNYILGWTLPLILIGLLFVCLPLLCFPLLGTNVYCCRRSKASVEEQICIDENRDGHRLSRKSSLFLHSTLIVAVFYSIPAIQLVFMHLFTMRISGDLDLCYYNFYCAIPLHLEWLDITISDFNHCYSNIGYVTLGILGWMVVRSREKKVKEYQPRLEGTQGERMEYDQVHKEPVEQGNEGVQGDPQTGRMEQDVLIEKLEVIERGIPPHFGIFYAQCVALIVEGVLSASYHICPNHSNFHRDTCFMYVSIMLTTLKLYHGRHWNSSTSAITAFICVAVVITLNVLGEKVGRGWFWSLFTLLHLCCCVLLSAQFFHMGQLRAEGPQDTLRKVWKTYLNDNEAKPRELQTDTSVYVLIILGNLFNLSWLIRGVILMPLDFGTHLLMLLGGNMVLYFGYYMFMKGWNKEKVTVQFWIMLLLAFICWIWGGAYFYQPKTSWELTPAKSRIRNEECLLLDFYDSHDLWHFLSAAGLFLTMTALLIIDDDLQDKPQDQIAIF